jgi:spermidine synthase
VKGPKERNLLSAISITVSRRRSAFQYQEMNPYLKKILFALFFVSGFCGLLYQVVWMRLAFASFGIITPVLSVVISVFMLGLACGSWAGGKWIGSLGRRLKISAIFLYAIAEFMIGLGAFAVPTLFTLGESVLLSAGESDSLRYLFFSAVVIALSIFPWCVFMGTTFPLMMAFVKEVDRSNTQSFSFLYLANVIGAMFGTLLTAAVLIELLGFRHTLWVAGGFNLLVAGASMAIGFGSPRPKFLKAATLEIGTGNLPLQTTVAAVYDRRGSASQHVNLRNVILFTTGLTSLAMEVVWTRAFTPVIGTQVYAFALLLFVYLLATWTGSYSYRRWGLSRGSHFSTAGLLALLSVFAFLPIVLNDPRVNPMEGSDPRINPVSTHAVMVLASIFPLCAALGFLTPLLIDEGSEGNPREAGKAYALNTLGCILGPLLASYFLLPLAGAKLSMVLLALPFLFLCFIHSKSLSRKSRWATGLVSGVLLVSSLFFSASYEEPHPGTRNSIVRRDHTATVISEGEGMGKMLWVNGIGITVLTPITKFMAHLPLAFHKSKPESALVICFGMGTTYRSLLSWDVQTTAVELVPSVKEAFGYYFDDAEAILKNPKGQIVIDDGRRFLKRTDRTFDVITIDPPPPHEAAGTSLLYSEEFYELVKQRLRPNGILQQWFTFGEEKTLQAMVRSLTSSFPYVRAFPSIKGWGYHFLASLTPTEVPAIEEIVLRLPDRARNDLLEWSNGQDLKEYLNLVLSKEVPVTRLLDPDPDIRITDDRPFNEYFWLRRWRSD